MTSPDRDYDEIIRRAFHGMADPIEPAGDGLARIRRQVAGPWLLRQARLLFTECVDLVMLVFVRVQAFGLWLHDRAARGAPARVHPGHRAGPHRRAGLGTLAWARPALAVASVLVVVAIGAVGLSPLRTSLVTTIGDFVNGGGGGGNSAAGGNPNPGSPVGARGGVSPSGSATPGQSGASSPRPSTGQPPISASSSSPAPTTQCSSSSPALPSPSPGPTGSSSPGASPSPSPSPTPTPSSTPSNAPAPQQSPPSPSSAAAARVMSTVALGSGGPLGSAPCNPAPAPSPSPSTSPPITSSTATGGLPAAAGRPIGYGPRVKAVS